MERKAEIRGVLYDMDGTILNTEHVHYDGWELAFRETGVPCRPEYIQAMRGVNREKQADPFEDGFRVSAASLQSVDEARCIRYNHNIVPEQKAERVFYG